MQADGPPAERREERRAPIELRVEYQRINMFFADYTRNISKGGTFVTTEQPLAVGTEFLFSLIVPSFETPLVFQGRVRWVIAPEHASEQRPAGMGIEFEYRDEVERFRIHEQVERVMTQQLGSELAQQLLGPRDH